MLIITNYTFHFLVFVVNLFENENAMTFYTYEIFYVQFDYVKNSKLF